jgi:lipoprotein-anchoring transpeptidase ErfK/SrfK
MRTRLVLATVVVMLASLFLSGTASASHDTGPSKVYFSETGHTLGHGFLDHWRHYGALPIFGYPLTEEFVDPQTGLATQYFERAVMVWHPDNSPGWQALLHLLGRELTTNRSLQPAFRPAGPGDSSVCTFFEETDHNVCYGFRAYWEQHGGLPTFGYPLSEELDENGRRVQYFERARFEWHPENAGTVYEVLLGRLGADAAERDRVDQRPIPKPDDVQGYDPGLWTTPAPPAPPPVSDPGTRPPASAPTGYAKWIEVDLSQQYMRAWQYDVLMLGTYVSTGTWNYPTPTGYFYIFLKLRYDDMTSGLAAPPGEYYYVHDVPHVMYFADGGYAIHGAYWHNNFGSPYSHGCVSTPLWAAEWFYNWAPYGTLVWIHW